MVDDEGGDWTVCRRENVEREIRNAPDRAKASRVIGPITKGCDIFGLTKGNFSMIDIIAHVVRQIGPCSVDLGTWTASKADVQAAYHLVESKSILALRFLVDKSLPTRQPEYHRAVMDRFGRDSVRTAKLHAKFIVLYNDGFDVAVRTSMNLNMNKRIENFEISEGSPISDYLRHIVDHHFAMPPGESASGYKSLKFDDAGREKASKRGGQAKLGAW